MEIRFFFNKPEYLFQPRQILRRLTASWFRKTGELMCILPWGDKLRIQSNDVIGRGMRTLGVHELAVSEVLWRLTDRGDTCLDVGANVGYMTSLLSYRAGTGGRVWSFEPHPHLFKLLQENVLQFRCSRAVRTVQQAVGDLVGETDLIEPIDFNDNQGTAHLRSSTFDNEEGTITSYRVRVCRLDSLFSPAKTINVAKIDIEGAEAAVLRGASQMLSAGQIRDIVWEDNNSFPSDSVKLLRQYGYAIYRINKKLFGPVVREIEKHGGKSGPPWENVNFLATRDSARVQQRLRPRGWHCLSMRRSRNAYTDSHTLLS